MLGLLNYIALRFPPEKTMVAYSMASYPPLYWQRQWKTVASLARCSQAWLHALSQRSLQHPALKCIFSFSQLADIFHAARQPARWRHAVADVSHSSMFGKSMSGKLDTRVKLT